MIRPAALTGILLMAAVALTAQNTPLVDLLITNGRVLDGAGNPWVAQDIGITGDRIVFLGTASGAGVRGRQTLDVKGLIVTPGLWDAHSHADLNSAHGRQALPQLHQGITTVLVGVDGAGGSNVKEIFAGFRDQGIAVNALHYVGHGAARREVMGNADRPPTPAEYARMKAFIQQGMEEGAIGMSTGLFYAPGFFATTEEVIELNKVAARYGGIYDTHDRDLGAAYKGIGYDASVAEAIEIGEKAGTPVIFSHFNPQGAQNRGRAPVGARLIDEARARGVNVMAAQHPYDATASDLASYVIPRWAVVGGTEAMRARFRDPETRKRLHTEIAEMLAIRGGPEKIVITAQVPGLNGKSLADKATEWSLPLPEVVMRLLADDGRISVMNRELYDSENTDFLAKAEWMMTCTDGGTPEFGVGIVHPRSYGAFSKKLREMVYEKRLISLPFAIRGMTGLAATFFGIQDRGFIREGQRADIVVFDEAMIRDRATYEEPHQYSEGAVHVIVNGQFAIRDRRPTGSRSGQPIARPHSLGASPRASGAEPSGREALLPQ
jgi:N-acyl-D-amino-acid deacylase